MAQRLQTLTALAEDPISAPSTSHHTAAPGTPSAFFGLLRAPAHMGTHPHTYIKKSLKLLNSFHISRSHREARWLPVTEPGTGAFFSDLPTSHLSRGGWEMKLLNCQAARMHQPLLPSCCCGKMP